MFIYARPPAIRRGMGKAAISKLEAGGLACIILKPGQEEYEARIHSWWSKTVRTRPWAIVRPRNTREVCAAVKAIVDTPYCPFAIRSGGHNTCGSSMIQKGIIIDLSNMVGTTYDPVKKIVSILPGESWTEVYTELEKHDRMVSGSRESYLSVGGVIMGGGVGLHISRVGFTCDQVVNFVLVDCTGTAKDVNESTHPELFQCLKGGGSNFGIVTRFDLETFEAPKNIVDGEILFSPDAIKHLAPMFLKDLETVADRPDCNVVLCLDTQPGEESRIRVMFNNLDGVKDHPDLMPYINSPGGEVDLQLTSIAARPNKFDLLPNRENVWCCIIFRPKDQIIPHAASIYRSMLEYLTTDIPSSDFISNMTFQHMPVSYAKNYARNAVGFQPSEGNCLYMTWFIQVPTPALRKLIVTPFKLLLENLECLARSLNALASWYSANYCPFDQDSTTTVGIRNNALFRQTAARYDPNEIFQKRVPGGFKIPEEY